MTKKWKLTHWIMLGMILGIVVGYACHQYAADEATAKAIAADFGVVTTIFLHMVKMIIAPLVFATLVSGIASMDSGKSIGRIGAKVLGWFIVASLVSLSIGLLFVNIAKAGANLNMPLPPANASTHLQASALSVKEFYRCIGVVPVWRAQHLGLHSQALIFGECRGWLECRRRDSCVRNARVTNAATFARAKFKLMIGPA